MLLNQDIFELTEKGKHEVSAGMQPGGGIVGDARFILPLFVNGLTLGEVVEKLPSSVRACCMATVNNLLTGGYIVAHAETELSSQPPTLVSPTPSGDEAVLTVVEEDAGLDFTGRFPGVNPKNPELDKRLPPVVVNSLDEEIESRSEQRAIEKIKQFEQDMNNTFAQIAEHEILLAEQEKLSRQQAMVESARLSPIYENLRELVFFKDFSDAELAEVLHVGVWRERKEQDFLLHEGDSAKSFYVMLRGFAGVVKRERLIGLIRSGESFSEFSFLLGDEETHHADVIARSHVEFMEFSTDKLGNISLETRFQFAAAFSRCQTRHLVCANKQIVNLLTHEN